MIRHWRHKGLKKFFESGVKTGIQAKHAETLQLLLFQLANATKPNDMNTPGNYFHKLSGELNACYSVKVDKNWRLIFKFDGQDAIEVNYIDYH